MREMRGGLGFGDKVRFKVGVKDQLNLGMSLNLG